jgi:hypothetical protein
VPRYVESSSGIVNLWSQAFRTRFDLALAASAAGIDAWYATVAVSTACA